MFKNNILWHSIATAICAMGLGVTICNKNWLLLVMNVLGTVSNIICINIAAKEKK